MPVLKMSVIGVIGSFALCAAAQEKQVKHVPIQRTSPASAKEMFMTYCAVCHGKDAKGDGPAARALNKQPADLTRLAAKNGGNLRIAFPKRFGVM